MELSQLLERNTESDSTEPLQWWKLEDLKIVKARQQGDCLYLHCQTDFPSKIVGAIATDVGANSTSTLLAEGISRIKIHGKTWALGVDLPIGQAAQIAAEIVEYLLKSPPTAKTALKVLLKQNCLNILCESSRPLSEATIALPILNALRQTKPSDYLQSVTVSGRVKGEKLPSWTFDIDLLAIGIASNIPTESIRATTELEQKASLANPITAVEAEEEEEKAVNISAVIGSGLRYFICLDWLFTKGEETTARTIGRSVSGTGAIAASLSLILGVMAVLLLDRQLAQYIHASQIKTNQLATQNKSSKVRLETESETPNYNIALLNEKLDLLKWHVSAFRQAPDVMIVGSSRALRGVDPTVLEQSLKQQGFRNPQVFNFGINGATAKVVNLQIARILSSSQLPRMIIWADGVRAFNSNRTDITYNEIAASPGFTQLNAKKSNKNNSTSSEEETSEYQEQANATGQSAQKSNIAYGAKSKRPLEIALEQILGSVWISYANREQLRFALTETYSQTTKALGNSETLIAAGLPSRSLEADAKGFIALDVKFDPQTYFQTYPSVPGDYDLDYRGFDLNGSQMDAFNALSNFCRRHNINLVFVNMPLHSVYLDAARSRYEVTFSARMKELAALWNFTYIDLSHAWTEQSEYYSDPSHLNRQGAIAVSQALANNKNINWQVIR